MEGKRDVDTRRALGFTGPIEKVNRGWDRPRLVAYLHSEYCISEIHDGGPSVIVLMDWDRTGGRIQAALRDRLVMVIKNQNLSPKQYVEGIKVFGDPMHQHLAHALPAPILCVRRCINDRHSQAWPAGRDHRRAAIGTLGGPGAMCSACSGMPSWCFVPWGGSARLSGPPLFVVLVWVSCFLVWVPC